MFQLLEDILVVENLWTFAFSLLAVILVSKWIAGWRKKLPPGPRGLPLFGYLPFLGKFQHLDFMKLHEKYGPVFSLKLGVFQAVVFGDMAAIKEAFNKEEFGEKHSDLVPLKDDLPHMTIQKEWREWRKFTMTTLRLLGMGSKKLEGAIQEEVQTVLSRLSRCNGDVNVHEILSPAVNSIIISMICGKKLQQDEHFSKTVDVFSNNMLQKWSVTMRICLLPFLKPFYFLSSRVKQANKIIDKMEKRFWEEIASHEKEQDATPEDYIDYYFQELKKEKGYKDVLDKNSLNGNGQILLLAANDTTLATMGWVLMRMALHPEIQERVYQEIVQVFGKERTPSWYEKDQLPYLDAVLAESSRMHTITPLTLAIVTSRDTKIKGYDIPKGTLAIKNIYAVHMDPELWADPESFNPDRFLMPNGKRAKDPEHLIPFGFGKRICVGEKLAKEEVFAFVSAILQHFKILPPSGGLKMDCEAEFVIHPKYPIVRVQPRT